MNTRSLYPDALCRSSELTKSNNPVISIYYSDYSLLYLIFCMRIPYHIYKHMFFNFQESFHMVTPLCYNGNELTFVEKIEILSKGGTL